MLLSLLMFFPGCATVPRTERKSLNIVPHSQMLALSLEQYGNVLRKSTISKDRRKVRMVRRVGGTKCEDHEGFPEGLRAAGSAQRL